MRGLTAKQQGRLDSFFTVKPKDPADAKKRKVRCRFSFHLFILTMGGLVAIA